MMESTNEHWLTDRIKDCPVHPRIQKQMVECMDGCMDAMVVDEQMQSVPNLMTIRSTCDRCMQIIGFGPVVGWLASR